MIVPSSSSPSSSCSLASEDVLCFWPSTEIIVPEIMLLTEKKNGNIGIQNLPYRHLAQLADTMINFNGLEIWCKLYDLQDLIISSGYLVDF